MPAARRKLARGRQQMLSTMVMMGINRIVVTSGRICAKMGFHIDAHDHAIGARRRASSTRRTSTHRDRLVRLRRRRRPSTRSPTSRSTKKDSSDAINVTTDLTGEVDLRFKSDYLPLERMATPQMIGAIQGNTPNPAANTPQTGGDTSKQPVPATQ